MGLKMPWPFPPLAAISSTALSSLSFYLRKIDVFGGKGLWPGTHRIPSGGLLDPRLDPKFEALALVRAWVWGLGLGSGSGLGSGPGAWAWGLGLRSGPGVWAWSGLGCVISVYFTIQTAYSSMQTPRYLPYKLHIHRCKPHAIYHTNSIFIVANPMLFTIQTAYSSMQTPRYLPYKLHIHRCKPHAIN